MGNSVGRRKLRSVLAFLSISSTQIFGGSLISGIAFWKENSHKNTVYYPDLPFGGNRMNYIFSTGNQL